MKIKKIISQSRRDLLALYQCEYCGSEHEGGGYDDAYFHQNVIPDMVCKNCGRKAGDKYKPKATRYLEGMQV